jgi:dihydroneopterin aldolase/2-amino-4-hydroxy-6-hydroxymethyldihydropteridine diphosphokinase
VKATATGAPQDQALNPAQASALPAGWDLVKVAVEISAEGRHGVYEHERASPRRFGVCVELAGLRGPAEADSLEGWVDYETVALAATRLVEETSYLTLEALSRAIADAVEQEVLPLRACLSCVRVSVTKPDPPVAGVTASAVTTERRIRRLAYVGLGSNLGDRAGFLRLALSRLPGLARVSSVYESEPVGGPPTQPLYLNAVAELHTDLDPFALASVLKQVEEEAGRRRSVRWGPRTLDLDLLIHGGLAISTEGLVVPHPRMWERRFVLAPLSELRPDLVGEEAAGRAGGWVRRVGRLW